MPARQRASQTALRRNPRMVRCPAGGELDLLNGVEALLREVDFYVHFAFHFVKSPRNCLSERRRLFVDLLEHIVVVAPFSAASASQWIS